MSRFHQFLPLVPALLGSALAGSAAPQWVPLPKSLTLGQGVLTLTKDSSIAAANKELEPLATLLAGEIKQTTGVELVTAEPKPGGAAARPAGSHPAVDIVLRLDPGLKGEAYTLTAGTAATAGGTLGSVTVAGGTYQSVASGTVTLLQALRGDAGTLTLPQMQIADEPVYAYRGALIDLARKYHSPGGIEQVIELCRLYKIRYLHLNLSDDQLFMFPSTRFPQIGKSNQEFARFEPGSQPHCAPYTLDQLKGLESYAKQRGVYLVPEINFPGHSGRLIADARDPFGLPGNGSTVHIANPKTLAAVSVIINEMMDVFQSTPYIHLGADEVGLGGLEQTPEYKQLQATAGIKSAHDLYCKFIADLNAIVTKRGKKSIVWEEAWNPGGTYPLPKDVTVMAWTHGRNPADIAKAGYQVINAMWTPLYIVRGDKRPLDFLFNWNLAMFGRGHLGDDTFTTLTDTGRILGTQLCSWENAENIEIQSMRERLALVAEKSWSPAAGGTLAEFKARLAHTDQLLDLLVNPISIQVAGTFTRDENTFTEPLTITLVPRIQGLTLKYTLDNSLPNAKWRVYSGPIKADATVHLRAGLFDDKGVQQGHLVGSWFNHKQVIKPNLATGKPATAGPPPDPANGKTAAIAVDGKADNVDDYWDGGEGPHWLQVDLLKVQPVSFINVITYWDGSRYYQLNAEVSVDGKQWKKMLDFTTDTAPATAAGYSGKFPPTPARYVRVNMLKNSANPSVHIVELIVE
ncbi:MAG: family 20 glycosylhydrolase [Verrucomicrobiota bacterium]